jgi:hypothetical protein
LELKSEILEIKFSGDIKPETLSLEELSSELVLFNKLIKPIIEEQFPNEQIPSDIVGLLEIRNNSLSFRYLIKDGAGTVRRAFAVLLIAINTHDIGILPARTIDTLEKTSAFNERYNVTSHFGEVINNEFVSHSSFKDEFKAEKIGHIKGPTTVYGFLKWIGGDNPKAKLVLDNRSEIKIILNTQQATKCAPYLYSYISVHGIGTWKGFDLKLTQIEAQEVIPFENTPPDEGFDFLRDKYGKYYDDLDPKFFG